MHKGIILLVKTNSEEDAEDLVVEFLTNYRDTVYDWYEIGGRWDKLLGNSNIMKLSKCLDIVKDYKKDLQKEIEEAWNTLLESKNGYHAKQYAYLKKLEIYNDSNVLIYKLEKLRKFLKILKKLLCSNSRYTLLVMSDRHKLLILAKTYMLINAAEGQLFLIKGHLTQEAKYILEQAIKSVGKFVKMMEKVLTEESIETAYDSTELITDVLDIIIDTSEKGTYNEFKKYVELWKTGKNLSQKE
jgi:hypothetical protein